jgi:hypothetical protein
LPAPVGGGIFGEFDVAERAVGVAFGFERKIENVLRAEFAGFDEALRLRQQFAERARVDGTKFFNFGRGVLLENALRPACL